MADYVEIGMPTPRVDGVAKVTGAARYVADQPIPGALSGALVHSTRSHARIVEIDTAEARALPGVHAVITGEDVGHYLYGRMIKDIPVLARGVVRYSGERVAAVAAETEEIARHAADLIEVTYEELPAVLDLDAALAPDAPVLHPDLNSYPGMRPLDEPSNAYRWTVDNRGDLDAGFAEADIIVEGVYETQRHHQAYLEPHASVVSFEDGRAHVWTNTKAPQNIRDDLAATVGISRDEIVLHHSHIGGDFGGKGTPMDLAVCYFLAQAAGRPVRMVADYIEEFMAGMPRHSTRTRLRTGVMRDGTIRAHHVQFFVNSGAYAGYKPAGVIGGAPRAAGPYHIPNTRIEAVHVYTNIVPGGHMRAPGSPQAVFALESHLDEVAGRLGMDPFEFRMRNLIDDGEETAWGQHFEHVRVKETLEAAADAAGYAEPRAPLVGRGIAIGDHGSGGGIGNAEVALEPGGRVVLGTAIFDQGSGTHTTLQQVVAEELRAPLHRIELQVWDTDGTVDDSGIGGSRASRVNTNVAYQAAQDARRKLVQLVAERLGEPEAAITLDGDEIRVEGREEVLRWPELLVEWEERVVGRAYIEDREPVRVTGFVAQVAEVEVDPETGELRVLGLTTAHDVGRVLNPVGHQGQINGGVVQGLGYALMEELAIEDGRVTTLSFGDYKIPTSFDIPELRTVLLESEDGVGPYAIKGIGETPNVPVAAAIANAVADAVGVRIADLPLTSEKVYRALADEASRSSRADAPESTE
ncbi:MAG: xanthine dehydrogenase family protein molybdopterin-binding subunit [Chloroflexi bacterium]|nr:xanthine dehydrogenase family protein molybdopterin-binding subunit [Chloroflexota bacterium]